uniref:Uncharacterized protein n=1 Tax=Ascaris lumbricoides TaxID=6252 RepID=A0A0M3IA10_ASCLU
MVNSWLHHPKAELQIPNVQETDLQTCGRGNNAEDANPVAETMDPPLTQQHHRFSTLMAKKSWILCSRG